ncbi:MAG TPA: flavin reductase family protein [Candidatus Limnocylindria bacterium]|nr:flavin reductase family protein [Candidatus Limnocylindria bacterium]
MTTRIERGVGAATVPISEEQQTWLRSMMGRFATGVTVVAARTGPLLAGMTANAIASVSIDPPLMVASLSQRSETHRAIVESHSFALSVLSADQQPLAECFAAPITAAKLNRFCDASWHEAETGSPILDGAIAYFDCRLVARHPGGDHTLFVGEIVSAGFEESGEPLLYFGSGYRRLAPPTPRRAE